MDRLEQYLDQVCRGVGGPRALRQHVRRELREHLLDAAAKYKDAGVPEGEALDRAVADFGRPEDVRSDLAEAHGQRLMAVVIDKALDWKEKTMRAKWLWSTWAHVAVAVAIVVEVMLIAFVNVFITPKFKRLMQDGMIDGSGLEEQGVGWMVTFLKALSDVGAHYTTPLLLLTIAAVVLFEWRVKNENKSFIRLSTWGTVAAGLAVVVLLMTGSLVVPFTLAMPAMGQMARPWAAEQLDAINGLAGGIADASSKQQWDRAEEQSRQAAGVLARLSSGPAVAALARGNNSQAADHVRDRLKEAQATLLDAQAAITARDAERVNATLGRLQETLRQVPRDGK